MKTFLLVKGKQGSLVGDPDRPGRFAGQRKLSFKEGEERPQRLPDHYEPCWTVHDYGHCLRKAERKSQLAEFVKVNAKSKGDALTKIPKSKAPFKKGDSK